MEKYREVRPRPNPVPSRTSKVPAGCGNVFVTIGQMENDGDFVECFVRMGKMGGCSNSWAEGLGRMISMALRLGADPVVVHEQLKGVRCPKVKTEDGFVVQGCVDAVARGFEMLGIVEDRPLG